MAPGQIADLHALWCRPPNQLVSATQHRALQTFARRQTALVRLVERGPDGLPLLVFPVMRPGQDGLQIPEELSTDLSALGPRRQHDLVDQAA